MEESFNQTEDIQLINLNSKLNMLELDNQKLSDEKDLILYDKNKLEEILKENQVKIKKAMKENET